MHTHIYTQIHIYTYTKYIPLRQLHRNTLAVAFICCKLVYTVYTYTQIATHVFVFTLYTCVYTQIQYTYLRQLYIKKLAVVAFAPVVDWCIVFVHLYTIPFLSSRPCAVCSNNMMAGKPSKHRCSYNILVCVLLYTRHGIAVRQDLMGAKLESNGFTGAGARALAAGGVKNNSTLTPHCTIGLSPLNIPLIYR